MAPWRDRQCGSCCWRRRRREPKAMPTRVTPLPWTKILIISAVLFVNQFGINLIFPFLPFMIHDFFPYLDKTELGKNAGYLGSAYFVGSFTGSLFWGWISDKIGRRPVLLMGMLGTLATELLFGFSQNFAWAIAARFLWGLLNGNLGVAKTYISEVCDDSNQAKGFAAIGTSDGIGRLSGSIVGGFLAQPASKFGPLKIPFFCQYPYSLPCIVGGALAVISFIAAFFLLEESLYTKKNRDRRASVSSAISEEGGASDATPPLENKDSSSSLRSTDSGIVVLSSTAKLDKVDSDTELIDVTQPEIDDDQLIMVESDIDTDSDFERVNSDIELLLRDRKSERLMLDFNQTRGKSSIGFRTCVPECVMTQCGPRQCCRSVRNSLMDSYRCVSVCVDCLKGCGSCRKRQWTPGEVKSHFTIKLRTLRHSAVSLVCLVMDRRVFLSTFLYGLLAFISIMCQELIPLLLVTDHDSGGYNMDDSEIGVVLMSVAAFQFLWQAFVFPRIAKCLGYRYTFLLGVLLFGVTSIVFPFSNKISGPIPDDNSLSTGGSGNWSYSSEPNFCDNELDGVSSVNEYSVSRITAKVWVTLIFINGVWIISRVMAFTSVMVLISNSSLTETRGTVNGFGQALCAIGRGLGPAIGTPVFAWSENTGKGWPLNHHFVFDLLFVGSLMVAGISLLLPRTIEMKRMRKAKDISEQILVEDPINNPERTQQSR